MKRLIALLFAVAAFAPAAHASAGPVPECHRSADIEATWTTARSWCWGLSPTHRQRIVVRLFSRATGEFFLRRGPWVYASGAPSTVAFNNNRHVWIDWWVKVAPA